MIIDYRFLDSMVVVKKVIDSDTLSTSDGTGLSAGDLIVQIELSSLYCYAWNGESFESIGFKLPKGRFILNLEDNTVYQVGTDGNLTLVRVLSESKTDILVVRKIFDANTSKDSTGLSANDLVADVITSSPSGVYVYSYDGSNFDFDGVKLSDGRLILNLDDSTVYKVENGTTLTSVGVLGGSSSDSKVATQHHISYTVLSSDESALEHGGVNIVTSGFEFTVSEMSNIMLFVNGMYQVYNVDYELEINDYDKSVYLKTLNHSLENVLKVGDVINLYYYA